MSVEFSTTNLYVGKLQQSKVLSKLPDQNGELIKIPFANAIHK